MARTLTDDEIKMLLKLEKDQNDPKAGSNWINDPENRFGFLDAAEAVKKLSNARTKAAGSVPTSGIEQVLGLGGITAGAASLATARMAELVKGSTTTYEALLRREEIAGRLRTALGGDFGIRESGEEIVVSRVDPIGVFCRIRVSVAGDKTTIVVSGVNLTKTTQSTDNVIGGLMNLGKGLLQGDSVVDGVLDTIGEAVNTAKEAGSDLWVANTVADVIEKYGADRERVVEATQKAARAKTARITEISGRLSTCESCGQPLSEDGVCNACGATTDAAALRAELTQLQKS